MTNNINSVPQGTLSLYQIENAANDIVHTWRWMTKKPTASQIREAVERYCDDPDINTTDKARIRVRIESIL